LITSPQVASNLLKWLWYSKSFIDWITKSIKLGNKITPSQMKILENWAKWLIVWGMVEDNLSLTD
jgi:hypothetical protein